MTTKKTNFLNDQELIDAQTIRTGFIEINLTDEGLRTTLSAESKELFDHLEKLGITFKKKIEWCG